MINEDENKLMYLFIYLPLVRKVLEKDMVDLTKASAFLHISLATSSMWWKIVSRSIDKK